MLALRCFVSSAAYWFAVTSIAVPAEPVRRVDLTQTFRRATVQHSSSTKLETASSSGKKRASIFQHANPTGQPLATIAFPPLRLTKLSEAIERIVLQADIGFRDRDRQFNIVAIDAGNGQPALLKSLTVDGRMEGTIYIVPFRHQTHVVSLAVRTDNQRTTIGEIKAAPAGHTIEITFQATAPGSSQVTVATWYHQHRCDELTKTFSVAAKTERSYRYALTIPSAAADLAFTIDTNTGTISNLQATMHSPTTETINGMQLPNTPASGGVTFDLLRDE